MWLCKNKFKKKKKNVPEKKILKNILTLWAKFNYSSIYLFLPMAVHSSDLLNLLLLFSSAVHSHWTELHQSSLASKLCSMFLNKFKCLVKLDFYTYLIKWSISGRKLWWESNIKIELPRVFFKFLPFFLQFFSTIFSSFHYNFQNFTVMFFQFLLYICIFSTYFF